MLYVRRLLPIDILLMMYLYLLYPYVDRLLTLLLFVLSLIQRRIQDDILRGSIVYLYQLPIVLNF